MAWPTRLGLATLAWLTDLVRLELGSIGFLDLLDMPGLLDCLGFWRNRLQHYNGAVFFLIVVQPHHALYILSHC